MKIKSKTGSIFVIVPLLFCFCVQIYADDPKSIEDIWSPGDIQMFREKLINDFQRTGLNTTPGDATMLRILIESANLKRGIEVGSASGFGAVNMGIAFERTGGELITIDIDPKMIEQCRDNIKKAGLEKTVKIVEGDALKVIPQLEGKFDFIFIDAVKQDYFKYFKAALPALKPGTVIVADNVIKSAAAMKDFLDAMESDPDYDMVIIRCSDEKGDGMAVIYKIK